MIVALKAAIVSGSVADAFGFRFFDIYILG